MTLTMAQQLALSLLESRYFVHPDYAEAARVLKASFEAKPQAQDSTTDQLQRLVDVAHHEGLYDAADFILRHLNKP